MKIIGIAGRKQAGKNTVANYINGHVLKHKNMINDFAIDSNGMLVVNTQDITGQSGFGIFDVTRKDSIFVDYAERDLWPYVKVYHFADPLKEMAVGLFGLKPSEVYGSDDQKNLVTNINWESMPDCPPDKAGPMTNREFLEHFGTKIVRKIKRDAWSEYAINKVVAEQSEIAIIPDVRFPNEVESIQKNGGIVIRLTRNAFNSNAEAEKALDKENFDWKKFDLVIDNHAMSLTDLCDYLKNHSHFWGY